MSSLNSTNYLVQWLVDFEIAAALLLGVALIGVRWIRQPARRVTLGWNVSLALAVLLAMAAVPVWPRWHAMGHRSSELALRQIPAKPSGTGDSLTQVPRVEPTGVSASPVLDSEILRPADGFKASKPVASVVIPWLGRLFLLGAAITGAWLILGWIQAVRICRRARSAPVRLQEQLQSIAGGQIAPPRLLLSGDVPNAVAVGVFRPTILLPVTLVEQAPSASLRAVLAHEMAHIRNRDLWLVGLLRCLLPVLFPQPLFWLLRHIIRSSQEAVADAVAAESRGCDYADGLIGWMRQVTSQKRMLAVPSVGIWERPSELSRRITLLISDKFTVQTNVSPRWRMAAAILTGVLALGLSALSVRPVSAGDTSQGSQTTALSVTNSPATNVLAESFTGRVVDKVSHEPVPGAIVHVRREISSSTEYRVVEETEHTTGADGRFQFSLAPEFATNGHAYLNFEVTHTNYARRPWDGYALAMIRKNKSVGAPPFFENLELSPGESISGTLVRPDGTPAVGVKILTYSKARKDDMADYGSFADTRTDDSGHFQVNVVKGGEAVLWILPQDFAPSTHLLHQQRGDLGQITLADGIRLSGQVLTSDGSPAGSVWVNAEIYGGPAKQRIDMPVIDALSRSALTDSQGHFTMGPLPAGDYDLLITEYPRDSLTERATRHSVPDVFLHQKIHLDSSQPTASTEIRAVPHVVVTIQQLNSKGSPHKTHEINASGQLDGNAWWGDGRPDENGKIVLKVPRGLMNARFDLQVNEHQSTRYRWSDDSPWGNEHSMTAAVMDQDQTNVSVIYYTSPVLLVRATAEDGSSVTNFKCQLDYAKGRKQWAKPPNWISGAGGDVDFEKQPDGRWRSESLLPDEYVKLTVQADGFQTSTQTVSLPEGATREVVAKLERQ